MNESVPRRPGALLALLLALLLGRLRARGRRTPPLAGRDAWAAPFTLTDQNGRRVSDRDFAGKYRLVYFGYTFCPDVCPVDMQVIGAGLRQFEASDPARAARVQPIFISVDPARDTPPVLRQFVAAFHPRLIGLTGSEAEIAQVAREYRDLLRARRAGPGRRLYGRTTRRMAVLYGPEGQPIAIDPARPGRRPASPPSWSAGCDEGALLGSSRSKSLDREEWEALVRRLRQMLPAQARGRGRPASCTPTNVACRLLDRTSCRCSNYKLRRVFVPDCVRLDVDERSPSIDWLPSTCAYRLRAEGKPLRRLALSDQRRPRDGARGRHVGARLDDLGGRSWRSRTSSRRP